MQSRHGLYPSPKYATIAETTSVEKLVVHHLPCSISSRSCTILHMHGVVLAKSQLNGMTFHQSWNATSRHFRSSRVRGRNFLDCDAQCRLTFIARYRSAVAMRIWPSYRLSRSRPAVQGKLAATNKVVTMTVKCREDLWVGIAVQKNSPQLPMHIITRS